jgi:thiol-disulfide isomerase/thioredoxin
MRLGAWLVIAVLALVPAPACAWTLQDMQGHTLDQAAFHGRWVLVNFWATWCPPCRKEIPELIRLQHDEAGRLTIIGIAVSYSNAQSVGDFVRRHGMGYPIVLGNAEMAGEFGGFRGLPASFLYGPDGRLVHRFEGAQTEASITQAMGPPSPH